ncbi:hypothetical protein KUTeg_011974 [Tegillarca granosa]|uniref:Metalloendopeptidase n=1 Tax=Tegillarca granosa TaxID=220873 RepID=A0ABQ9EYF2_TEGGR|nr:hypothetical protein KUTeg_011974 [Tegillarca granosa]
MTFYQITVALIWRYVSGQSDYHDPPPADIGMDEALTAETIDQIIARSLGGMDVAANKMVGPGGNILAELDMLLTEEQFRNLYAIPELGDIEMMPYFDVRKKRFARRRQKRKAVRQITLKWHNREVPYRFASGHFISMREWEKYTCIMFREATSSDSNILVFQNGDGCNSQLGMVGGVQYLNLDINGCRWKGLYLHEIGHAIGLVHEHQLPNRDDFIEVMYGNVAPSMRIWFNKYNNREVNQYDVDYEYTSVMHYGITAFSIDGKQQTIKAKNASLESTIGRVFKKELSFSDVKSVNRMYECGVHCPSSVRCTDGGYVDQNCKCVCPDGTKKCQVERKNDGRPQDDDNCFNKHSSWQCYVWASQANHVATWAWQWFGVFANLFPKKWTIGGQCVDLYAERKCQHWQENGDCLTAEKWMTKNCKKTCKKCNVTTFDENCQNKYNSTKCDQWALKGECIINEVWMVRNCRKSCLKCTDQDDTDTSRDENDTERGTNPDRSNNDDRSRNRDDSNAKCIDEYNTTKCQKWARNGECRINKGWMIPNCRKSCKACADGDSDTNTDDEEMTTKRTTRSTTTPTTTTERYHRERTREDDRETARDDGWRTNTGTGSRDGGNDDGGESVNIHSSDQECNIWARFGHCDINPWMMANCKKSCDRTNNKDTGGSRKDNDPGCQDRHILCKSWSTENGCEKSPGYMYRYCQKTCKYCEQIRKMQT